MSRDPDAPEHVGHEQSKGWPERELDHIRGQLREGARTMGELRTGIERTRDELAQAQREVATQIAALQLAERDANEAIRRSAETRSITARAELEAKMLAETGQVAVRLRALEDTVAPRATAPRLLAWIAAVVLAAGPLIGWVWTRLEQIDNRVRVNESRLSEMNARIEALRER